MKRIFTLSILMISFLLTAQIKTGKDDLENEPIPPTPLTEADQFSRRSGTLMEKQVYEIGKVKRFHVSVNKYKDLSTGEYLGAIRIGYQNFGVNSSRSAILDSNEVDGFLKSLKLLKAQLSTKRSTYTEIKYKSRAYFEAGGFFDDKRQTWKLYMQLFTYDALSFTLIPQDELDGFIEIIEQSVIELKKPI
ncbi:MAG: hypothetical protein EOO85_16530 [Pedobacter sp.]|nr:MAG: hypothetical protein EOO85_16530 [Pedobacter sp.]